MIFIKKACVILFISYFLIAYSFFIFSFQFTIKKQPRRTAIYSDILLRNVIYMLCICDISASQMRYDINPRAVRHISHAFMHISHRKVYRKSVFGFISLKRLCRFNNYESEKSSPEGLLFPVYFSSSVSFTETSTFLS